MKKVLSIFFLLIILIVAIFIIYHGPVYTYRVLVWQDSDYDDYLLFNTKPVVKGKQTFNFESASPSQEDQFRKDFSIANSISNIDSLMIANNTYAFIVIRNDTLIYENYFFNNNRESMQTSFSTAKSILSLLIGIAIQENKIKSINDPITDYIPELKDRDSKFMEITIEDLLHMRSGIAFKKGVSFPFVTSDEPLTYSHPDLRYVAINKTRIDINPDIKFLYNDYNAL
ncbi:MAG: serine hydrolase, partial [Saprospiraceae bacterium]|nr:serine hydrolase [Saprospiraceae bacterium]